MPAQPVSVSHNSTRNPKRLNVSLNRALLSYVTAASAAGGALLANSRAANAEIVYTPVNTPITVGTPVSLDLNNDGIVDFVLSNNYGFFNRHTSCTVCSRFEHASLKATPEQPGDAIWGITSATHMVQSNAQPRVRKQRKQTNKTQEEAIPLPWGVVVGDGPGRKFESEALVMDSANYSYFFSNFRSTQTFGAWGKNRRLTGPYLGFKFMIGSEVHYGWARVAVKADLFSITATLTGYAYETNPNQMILSGFTSGNVTQSTEQDSSIPEAKAAQSATLGQ